MKGRKRKDIKSNALVRFFVLIFISILLLMPIAVGNNQITFSFKPYTLNLPPNKPTNPTPSDEAINIKITVTLRVFVTDPLGDAMDVYFYNDFDGSLIGLDTVSNGSYASCTWTNLHTDNNYYWYAIANDSIYENTSDVWSFSTESSTGSPTPNEKPIANITGPTIEYVNESFILSAFYSYDPDGQIKAYRWDFDNDGNFDTDWIDEYLTICKYHKPGNYTINLEVKDNRAARANAYYKISIIYLSPTLNRPIAKVSSPLKGYTNETILFNSSESYDPDGIIVKYKWDFGDQTILYENNPAHIYSESGNYIVMLTVTDNDNLSSTFVTTIYIRDFIKEDNEDSSKLILLSLLFIIILMLLISLFFISKRREYWESLNKFRINKNAKTSDGSLKKQKNTQQINIEKKEDLVGSDVLLKSNNVSFGKVTDIIFNNENKPLEIKIKLSENEEIISFPINLFDIEKDKLFFVKNNYDSELKILEQLKIIENILPDLKTRNAKNAVESDEFYETFIKNDNELNLLLKNLIDIKDKLQNELKKLERQKIILKIKLMELQKAKPSLKTQKDIIFENVLGETILIVEKNMEKCKDILYRIKQTSFGLLINKFDL